MKTASTLDTHHNVWIIGISNLNIIWNLGFENWDFRAKTIVMNCFNLTG